MYFVQEVLSGSFFAQTRSMKGTDEEGLSINGENFDTLIEDAMNVGVAEQINSFTT
jgi:hypothetical protein